MKSLVLRAIFESNLICYEEIKLESYPQKAINLRRKFVITVFVMKKKYLYIDRDNSKKRDVWI